MAGIGAATSENDNDVDSESLFLRLSIVPKILCTDYVKLGFNKWNIIYKRHTKNGHKSNTV